MYVLVTNLNICDLVLSDANVAGSGIATQDTGQCYLSNQQVW